MRPGEQGEPARSATGGRPMVVFDRVTKIFGSRVHAVHELNLTVGRNEFLTLLGPSGSGKTTTLMMLAGFDSPSSGRIELDGQPITHLPPNKREMGVVFQNYALFPHMSIAQNLAFPLEARGMGKLAIRDRVQKSIELVRLGDHLEKRPGQLSGGQQQRIALARALIFQPKIVLMDEPLSALDKQLRERMQLEIKALQRQLGITVIFVTHDQSEALVMSDRVAVFDHGRLQQVCDPRSLYDKPANAFIAGFIGESNMLAGTVMSCQGGATNVSTAAGMIAARTGQELSVGGAAVVSVRPEAIRILRDDETAANTVGGTLQELIFLGDHSRILVRVGENTLLSVKLDDKNAAAALSLHAPVRIGWSDADGLAFAANG
ncbi:MAG: ABC transporter ATP-binding protein [Candidatus Kaistia colombiensis]|nr:MAG: ABC transporter ATP-binding protein [Kaistia sp.]